MRPVARRTDPGTSWAAAESVRNVRESQWRVYLALVDSDGMTDEQLIALARVEGWPMSDSGIRTRRCELVDLGWVCDTGERQTTAANRQTIVWGVA